MLLTLLALSAANAASPAADRPSVSRTADLTAPGSLELEAGAAWSTTATTPLLLKYGVQGRVEPRVGFNPAGLGGQSPGLEAGAKVNLHRGEDASFALVFQSALPLGAEAYWGQAHALATFRTPSVGVQVNAGVNVAGNGAGGLAISGVPLVLLLSAPIGKGTCGFFVEGAASLSGATNRVVDGGLGCGVTESLILDVAGGYDISNRAPLVTAGLVANLGVLGGGKPR